MRIERPDIKVINWRYVPEPLRFKPKQQRFKSFGAYAKGDVDRAGALDDAVLMNDLLDGRLEWKKVDQDTFTTTFKGKKVELLRKRNGFVVNYGDRALTYLNHPFIDRLPVSILWNRINKR